MKKKFSKILAGMMAFMMLFASVVFADEKVKTLPMIDKTFNAPVGFSITREDCEKLTGYDENGNEITYYKYTFKPFNTGYYDVDVKTSFWHQLAYNPSNKNPIVLSDGTTLYTGASNIYINGGSETIPGSAEYEQRELATNDEVTAVFGTFKLDSNETYCTFFTDEQFDEWDGTLEYSYQIDTSIVEDEETGNYISSIEEYNKNEGDDTFGEIEGYLATFLVLVGKAANWMLASALHRTLTIDDIVFNNYDEIRLDYFNFGINGNTVTSNSSLINALKTPINTCYSVFTQIAIIGYVIVLVYIGIQMLLNSTSADKKASAKSALMYWVTGVVILFFYPYAMKYIILVEDALVRDIGKQRTYVPSTTELVEDGDNTGMLQDIDVVVVYGPDAKDYMSLIGYIAQQTKSLSVSAAYLILTWQLVMMVVYYYKRAFTVAFLIMVFPLVALTYVFDKLNDGKSQALSAWTREFVIDVVIQVFHAIVYIFVANTIYATVSSSNMDNILVMIAASFMFEGENIMKQIFGGGRTVSTGSVTQSGAKMAALAGFGIKTAAKTVKTGVKGVNGLRKAAMVPFDMFRPNKDKRLTFKQSLAKRSNTYRDLRDWKARLDLMHGGFDRIAENEGRTRRIADILPSSGDITQNINDTAEAIVDFTNGGTTKEAADGLYKLQELLKKRNSPNGMTDKEKKQFDAMLRASNISGDQLENIQKAMLTASVASASSKNPDYKRISRNLKLTVEYSFSNLDESEKKRMTNRIYAAAMYNLKNGYLDKEAVRESIENNWEEKRENTYQFVRNTKFKATKRNSVDSAETAEKMQKAARRFNRQLASQIKDYDSLPKDEKKKIIQVGNAISYIKLTEADQPEKLREHVDALNQNFGVNQQIVEEFIKKQNINVNDVQESINNRGAQLVKNRAEGLKQQYLKKYKDVLPENFDATQLDKYVEDYAKLELLHSGEISAFEAAEAVQNIDLSKEISNNLLRISNLDSEIDALKYMVAKAMLEGQRDDTSNLSKDVQERYDKSMSWAKDTVDTMENMASNPNEENPVASIYDIINAAKIRGGGEVGGIEDLYRNSSSDGMVDWKVDATVEAGKALGKKILGGRIAEAWNEKSYMSNDDGENQATVLGYTYADMIRLRDIETAHKAKEKMELFSDLTVKPTATFVGAMIGMALADDGMPLGEGITGMIAGATAADKLTESVSDHLTRDSKLQTEKNEIRSQVDRRLKKEEKERLKARQAFADAEASADDTYKVLRMNYASANYYKGVDGEGHVTVKVIAENATWMTVGEPNSIGEWFKYEEDYDYTLKNPKTSYLFIRLKDDSGNVVSHTVQIDNPDAK